MKQFLVTLFCLVACSLHASYATLISRCDSLQPERSAWLVTVTRVSDYGYCYGGFDEKIVFPCEVDGKIAKIGSQVLGYTDPFCGDFGNIVEASYRWSWTWVAVRILEIPFDN